MASPIETLVGPVFDRDPKGAFSKIKEAREVLRARADEFVTMQMRIIEAAIKGGDFETAAKANQWLMEHVPAEKDGTRMVDTSVDKLKTEGTKQVGPQINIGFALGGVVVPKQLGVEVIDAPLLEDDLDDTEETEETEDDADE